MKPVTTKLRLFAQYGYSIYGACRCGRRMHLSPDWLTAHLGLDYDFDALGLKMFNARLKCVSCGERPLLAFVSVDDDPFAGTVEDKPIPAPGNGPLARLPQ